jgi:hypothetical protein
MHLPLEGHGKRSKSSHDDPPSVRKYFAADAGAKKVTTSTNGGKKE